MARAPPPILQSLSSAVLCGGMARRSTLSPYGPSVKSFCIGRKRGLRARARRSERSGVNDRAGRAQDRSIASPSKTTWQQALEGPRGWSSSSVITASARPVSERDEPLERNPFDPLIVTIEVVNPSHWLLRIKRLSSIRPRPVPIHSDGGRHLSRNVRSRRELPYFRTGQRAIVYVSALWTGEVSLKSDQVALVGVPLVRLRPNPAVKGPQPLFRPSLRADPSGSEERPRS